MKTLLLLTILFFVVSCNTPEYRQTSDEDFKALLAESKSQIDIYPDSSLMILHQLLLQQQGDDKALNRGWVLNHIGVAYDVKGMYDSVAYYLYEASRLAEEIRDDSLLISVYSNLGILQFEIKNADEAIQYYRQSLAIAEKLKDSTVIAKQLNNIGNAYMTITNEFEKAIPWFEQCIEIGQKIGYSSASRVAGINLAMIYNATGNPDKAIQEAHKLIEWYGENTYADFTIAQAYHQKKQYRKAVVLYLKLLEEPLNTRELELVILKDLASSYQSLHDLNKAISYFEKYQAQKDSLHNLQIEKEIHNMKIAYETEKKEMQIAALQEEKQLILWISIAGGAVLLLSLATLFFLWRWTVQEKQLIATQAVLDGEVQERIRLARDLHDGLGSILAAAKYNLIDIRKAFVKESAEAKRFDNSVHLLDDSMREMRRIAHHLMPESLGSTGLKQSIADFCNSVSLVKFSYYGDDTRLDPQLEVMIYRIMHELVSNALKHSGASHILVEIAQDADRIFLTVQDNGCGFDTSAKFQGMGLANILNRVAAYGGNVHIHSVAGEGSEINIEFQLK
ncbi:MAG: tetratricopeptide repeat protein [Dysgonamonadaceae bacterium]|jgi:signal transduction histidine kinase|nr:tetratricopeptide repeat protein [Dysgonamonadaceae bacterium]